MTKNNIRKRIGIVIENIKFDRIIFDIPSNDDLSRYIDCDNSRIPFTINNNYKINELNDDCLLIIVVEKSNVNGKVIEKIANTRTFHQSNLIVIHKKFNLKSNHELHESLMSFGFKLLFQEEQEKIFYDIYEYNIIDYKNKPEWLNSDYWANPELWEK